MESPFKMKPGKGSSAKHTGKGMSERGLISEDGPKAYSSVSKNPLSKPNE
mgnify:FL=1|jgi:hypothetical protein